MVFHSGAREAFRLLKEKRLGRECEFVLVIGLVECKPSANKGEGVIDLLERNHTGL